MSAGHHTLLTRLGRCHPPQAPDRASGTRQYNTPTAWHAPAPDCRASTRKGIPLRCPICPPLAASDRSARLRLPLYCAWMTRPVEGRPMPAPRTAHTICRPSSIAVNKVRDEDPNRQIENPGATWHPLGCYQREKWRNVAQVGTCSVATNANVGAIWHMFGCYRPPNVAQYGTCPLAYTPPRVVRWPHRLPRARTYCHCFSLLAPGAILWTLAVRTP